MYDKNLNKMTQEQLRMQMLAGIITEGQYKAKLNEEMGKEDKIQQWVDTNAGGYGPDEDDENFPEFKKEMKDLLDNSLTTMNLEDFIENAIDIIEKYTINYYGDDTSFSPDDIKDDFYEFIK
jgi:hypothetical protein